ncbi:MAG: glycosyltransferase, partial [Microgenomates group bacterium]
GRLYSYLRFLLPFIWQSIDLTEYDLIITSCSGYIARGFKVRDGAKVVAYCHTPPRWLYGYDTPTGAQKRWWGQMFMWMVGPFVRYFDFTSAQRVDKWIANSKEVAGRIRKFYRKEATVVYPPIEIGAQSSKHLLRQGPELGYYLMVSRIVGGKGIGEAIEGATKAGVRLKIAGEKITPFKQLTIKPLNNIEYLGRVDDSKLAELYTNAKGFVALAHDEDFGMTVVESMAYGSPVLAYNGGGYKETVVEGKTGILINGTDTKSIAEGIVKMEKTKWDRVAIKKWASKFNRARFEKEISEVVNAGIA